MPLASEKTEQRVVTCYTAFDKFFPATGLLDYTEGIYGDDPATPYDVAKQRQFDYLLDQIGCEEGVRVLEVGCGNGTLLEQIEKRGATGVGITITPAQVEICRQKGLDARLVDVKAMGGEFDGEFDAVVANGPIEHFALPADAVQGRQDEIYAELFRTLLRVLDPRSPIRRVVNTTVHFSRRPDPVDLLRSPLAYRPFSEMFHYCLLWRSFGGLYPVDGQLEHCAQGQFELIREVDGTRDYYYTSEEWLRRIQRALLSPTGMKIAADSIPLMFCHPRQFVTMLTCMLVTQSWNWQFRGDDPPCKLWRQTWEAV